MADVAPMGTVTVRWLPTGSTPPSAFRPHPIAKTPQNRVSRAARIEAIVALRLGLVHAALAMGALKPKVGQLDSDPGIDSAADFAEVPAAVVCAFCGLAECPGCAEERTQSGIVAIVAWERPGSLMSRLWTTARSTTHNAEGFFQSLPDGQVLPALRFAMLAEMFAAGAMLICFAAIFVAVFPASALSLVSSDLALRALTLAVPGLAVLLVAAHAVHGLALEMGVAGNRRPSRGLRFGLYACGWDLVIGPLGFVVVAIKEGMAAALGLAKLAARLPGRSARAYLRGAHHLEGEHAKKPLLASYVAAVIATVLSALLLLAAALWLVAN